MEIALTFIFGIGRRSAKNILEAGKVGAGAVLPSRVRDRLGALRVPRDQARRLPAGAGAAGPARLGGALAERLLLAGAEVDAATLERAGFLAAVFGDGTDAWEALLAWYRAHLAPLSAFALREAVQAARGHSAFLAALGAPLDAAERRYLERLVPSHDGNEGIEAFLARRAPVWRDA